MEIFKVYCCGFILACLLSINAAILPLLAKNYSMSLFFTCFIVTVCLVLFVCTKKFIFLIIYLCLGFFLGWSWCSFTILKIQKNIQSIPKKPKIYIVTGIIDSIPEKYRFGVKFDFLIEKPFSGRASVILPEHAHKQMPVLTAGQVWQLALRLSRPYGLANEAGFSFEQWAMAQHIHAVGKVIWPHQNMLLLKQNNWSINFFREKLLQSFKKIEQESDPSLSSYYGIIEAITIGYRTKISDPTWQLFRTTNTSHLMAISGLHIGIMAQFGYLFIKLFAKIFPRVGLSIPIPYLARSFGAFIACVYFLMSGQAASSARAITMILLLLFSQLSGWKTSLWSILTVTLFLNLFLNPLSLLDPGFWLSYLAVGSLILIIDKYSLKNKFLNGIRIQLTLTAAMFPWQWWFFQQGPILAWVSNFFAIPLMSLIILPLSLMSLGVMLVYKDLGGFLLACSIFMLKIFIHLLQWTYQFFPWQWHGGKLTWFSLSILCIATLFCIIENKLYIKLCALLVIAYLCLRTQPRPHKHEFWISVLDVGQGLAVLVQTQKHVLLYDTGKKISERNDMAKIVIIPVLNYRVIKKIDKLIISHSDNDHIGGAETLLKTFKITDITSGQAQRTQNILQINQVQSCVSGQSWSWDGVRFSYLSPPENHHQSNEAELENNNYSCVLKIENLTHSIQLTGDIEIAAENNMRTYEFTKIHSDVITVPHHGSKTSSSLNWLRAVSPHMALISSGFNNQFHLPNPYIMKRYQLLGIQILNTADCGQINLQFPNSTVPIKNECFRKLHRNFLDSHPLLGS